MVKRQKQQNKNKRAGWGFLRETVEKIDPS